MVHFVYSHALPSSLTLDYCRLSTMYAEFESSQSLIKSLIMLAVVLIDKIMAVSMSFSPQQVQIGS